MNNKQLLYLSLYVKGIIIIVTFSLVTVGYLFSQLWSPLAPLSDIQHTLERSTESINAYNEDGLTPLIVAIITGDLNRVQLLLSYGADPNMPSRGKNEFEGDTPLHWVAIKGNFGTSLAIAKALLDVQADPSRRNNQGQIPLMLLPNIDISSLQLHNTRNKMLALFLDHGASINAADVSGQTILHQLVARNDTVWYDQLMQLYKDRLDLSLRDEKGRTPLDFSRELGREYLTEQLEAALLKR